MKKLLFIFALFSVSTFVSAQNAIWNYSWCCSWHKWVLGVCNGIVACNDWRMDSTCSTPPWSVYNEVNAIVTEMNQITEQISNINKLLYNSLNVPNTFQKALYNEQIYKLHTEFQNLMLQKDSVIQMGLAVEYNSCVMLTSTSSCWPNTYKLDWNCGCNIGYSRDSSWTGCIKVINAEETCKSKHWINSKANDLWQCFCEHWYVRNDDNTKCIKRLSENDNCKLKYGDNYRSVHWTCICEVGYEQKGEICEKEITSTPDTKKSIELKSVVTIIINEKLATKTSIVILFTNCAKNNKNSEIREACWIVSERLDQLE